MPAEWRISYWPPCVAYVFLSHCAEDREMLVTPVYKELQSRGIAPWLDRYHYPMGRESIETLHEELLKARHVAYFITPAMLRQGRGWTSSERAFTATIQQQLRYGHEVAHVELPLLFVPTDDPIFQRSIWCSLREKGIACPHLPANDASPWRQEHIEWTAATIEKFVRQEETWSLELAKRFNQDGRLSDHFSDSNLRERLLAQSPPPLGNS
jgi:hypothetical protein